MKKGGAGGTVDWSGIFEVKMPGGQPGGDVQQGAG